MPLTWLAVLGAGILIAGSAIALLPRAARAGLWIQAAGTAAVGASAAVVLVTGVSLGSGFTSRIQPALGVDRLSAFFMFTVAMVAVPALLYASRYLEGVPRRPVLAALSGAFTGALLLVPAARDLVTFLAGWELMTILPAAAMLVLRPDRPVRHAAFVYLAVTHLGGAGVWLCLILLVDAGALGDPTALARSGPAVQLTVAIAAVIGFGTKAGLMPMHSWLPRAHPVAPAHISAMMSGVMIKVALYGLIRVLFDWAPHRPGWLAAVVLGIGALSALGGVLYALFEHDLKRLLAFHSIENVGIITLGIGAAMLFDTGGRPDWSAIALAAALLHTLNHALFKALLFLGAGAIERAARGHDLDHLGGLLARMPVTGAAFLVGSAAIAGLPPLNGFVSEWLTLQALIHLGTGRIPAGWLGPFAAAALAITAALAVFCFVKVVGLILLGRARRPALAAAIEVPPAMRRAQATLAGACVLLGLAPGLLAPELLALGGAGSSPGRRLDLYLPGTGGLPGPWLAVALVAGACILFALRQRRFADPAPAWTCGQVVEPSLAWTSAAFTKPLRLSFETLLRPTRDITLNQSRGILQSVTYSGHVPHLFDTAMYGPVTRSAIRLAAGVRRLQSGRLGSYAITLVLVVVVLIALARAGWTG